MALDIDEFPIPSQTSSSDKQVLLTLRRMIGGRGSYSYFEIGSFLGGSIVPFARDPRCLKILSVDHREQQQPDERGALYDYKGVTSSQMIKNLSDIGIDTKKIKTFDLSISDYPFPDDVVSYDILFIDGEHTDSACFRDFIYGRRLLSEDSVVCFHDSTIIWRAIYLICELLRSEERKFRIFKVANTEMVLLLFGVYEGLDVRSWFDVEPDLSAFFRRAESIVFGEMIKNRIKIKKTESGFSLAVGQPQLKKAF